MEETQLSADVTASTSKSAAATTTAIAIDNCKESATPTKTDAVDGTLKRSSSDLKNIRNSDKTSDKQPDMDCLLEKLRKGMTELSHQGDDFTKQMWDMYATFEDMISGSGQHESIREERRSKLLDMTSTTSLNSNPIPESVGDSSISSSSVSPESDSIGTKSEEPETNSNSHKVVSNVLKETTNIANNIKDYQPKKIGSSSDEMGRSSGDDKVNLASPSSTTATVRRFRPIGTRKNKLIANARNVNNVNNSVNNNNQLGVGGYQSDSGSNSSLTNPLLDTISCLTSSDPYSDSDDYDITRKVYSQRHRRRCRRMLGSSSADRSLRGSPNHFHSCCSSDADSIGYAGSNSIDSGYKSLCPTPEVPDGSTSRLPIDVSFLPEKQAIDVPSNLSSALGHHHHHQQQQSGCPSSVSSSSLNKQSELLLSSYKQSTERDHKNGLPPRPMYSSSTEETSVGGGLYSAKIAARFKCQTSEAHLEHLLTLRQSLISAIQKCESAASTPVDSRVASPVISSRSTSPASTVIPRTLSTLKVPQSSALSITSAASTSSQVSGLSTSPTTVSPHVYSSTLTSKVKRLSSSPEPWYHHSPHSYSPVTSRLARPTTYSPNSIHKDLIEAESSAVSTSSGYHLSSVSSSSSSSLNKSVRFEKDVGSQSSIASGSTSTNKSILKDPICANLRSNLESGKFSVAQSLESEIDSLLYGKRYSSENRSTGVNGTSSQLSSSSSEAIVGGVSSYPYHHQNGAVDDDVLDIPYVTMIEEKYRAVGKKTGLDALKDPDESFPTSLIEHDTDSIVDDVNHGKGYSRRNSPRLMARESRLSNGVESKLSSLPKNKISEMARCMLGILDKIEMKNSIENRLPKLDGVRLRSHGGRPKEGGRPRPNSAEIRESFEMKSLFHTDTQSESSYHSLPEYHIYEEVLYDNLDDAGGQRSTVAAATATQISHPEGSVRRILPANPGSQFNNRYYGRSGLLLSGRGDFIKSCDGNNNTTIGRHETDLSRILRNSYDSPWRSWGRTATEQPKQRGNLYSLFTDPNQRMNISRSLEKEWNYGLTSSHRSNHNQVNLELCNRSESASSEYGFKN